MKTVIIIAISLSGFAATIAPAQTSYIEAVAYPDLSPELAFQLNKTNRALEEIKKKQDEANFYQRNAGNPPRHIFNRDGSLTLGEPYEDGDLEWLRKSHQEDERIKLESRRIAALEAIAQRSNPSPHKATATIPASDPQAAHEQVFQISLQRAIQDFPWMKDPKSSHFKQVSEIDRNLKKLGLPLYDNPQKPYILAQIVAANMR